MITYSVAQVEALTGIKAHTIVQAHLHHRVRHIRRKPGPIGFVESAKRLHQLMSKKTILMRKNRTIRLK